MGGKGDSLPYPVRVLGVSRGAQQHHRLCCPSLRTPLWGQIRTVPSPPPPSLSLTVPLSAFRPRKGVRARGGGGGGPVRGACGGATGCHCASAPEGLRRRPVSHRVISRVALTATLHSIHSSPVFYYKLVTSISCLINSLLVNESGYT